MEITTAWISDRGGREINDDTAAVLAEKGTYVFVGDGVGGYSGGHLASQAAAEAILAFARQGGVTAPEQMRLAVQTADQAVRSLQQQTQGKMKTTLVFLAIEEDTARWAHVGDSRLYHFRNGRILHQTQDHSVSQMAVLMGEITQREIRFHPDRNRIFRALGASDAKMDVSEPVSLTKKDAFLLCSDGFWEYVLEEEMEAALRKAASPEDWLDIMEPILMERAPQRNDNYTAAAVFCR